MKLDMSPGGRLRQAREAAGLTRDELALGVHIVPLEQSLMARAEFIELAERDLITLTPANLAAFEQLIETLVYVFADREARPSASAAA